MSRCPQSVTIGTYRERVVCSHQAPVNCQLATRGRPRPSPVIAPGVSDERVSRPGGCVAVHIATSCVCGHSEVSLRDRVQYFGVEVSCWRLHCRLCWKFCADSTGHRGLAKSCRGVPHSLLAMCPVRLDHCLPNEARVRLASQRLHEGHTTRYHLCSRYIPLGAWSQQCLAAKRSGIPERCRRLPESATGSRLHACEFQPCASRHMRQHLGVAE